MIGDDTITSGDDMHYEWRHTISGDMIRVGIIRVGMIRPSGDDKSGDWG